MPNRALSFAFATSAAMLAASAQAVNELAFAAVGSSAMTNVFRSAALARAGSGANSFPASGSQSSAVAVKDATGNTVGNLWVVWTGAAGNLKVWTYATVDSVVGVRGFFKNNTITFADAGVTGAGALNADVKAFLEGKAFNVGMTDVTPYDAKVATTRALGSYGTANPVQGYTGAGAIRNIAPVDFSLGARTFNVTPIGAVPVLVFVNKGSSLANATNVSSSVLRQMYGGVLQPRTSYFQDGSGNFLLNNQFATIFQREPTSGTYVTFEECIPRAGGTPTTQEANVSSNPLNENGWIPATAAYAGGGRVRAAGTGDLVTNVNRTVNGIGYAFWSVSNFATATNTKYVTVDGIEPLTGAYTSGAYPSGGSVTFRNVLNGTYPVWSVLRAVTEGSPSTEVTATIAAATTVDFGGNFAPLTDLKVFRSHRAIPGVAFASNGTGGDAEVGADAGGAIFPVQANEDLKNDFGFELTDIHQ